jgi:MoaA/NifB/PqqE/SkfB family radical SAM enzyme
MTFRNINGWPLEHWHIEICSKCSLRCPRCSRQEVPHGLENRDLSLEWFVDNFKGKLLSDVRKLTFCGDDGDPIYAKDLIKILQWFRSHNQKVQFVIVTNGSYKTEAWWRELDQTLDEKDHVHFSLDGWDQDSNDIYRKNCDWSSIMTGINTLKKSKAYKTWAAIAFKFNEGKIEHMIDLAKKLNFDNFQLTLSSKFNANYPSYPENDPLQPSDKFISKGRFIRQQTPLSDKSWQDNCKDIFADRFHNTAASGPIVPLCMIGNKGLYINAEGKFYPCCWTALRYPHNRDIFNYIEQGDTLGEILDDSAWKKLFHDMKSGKAPHECGEKCSANKWSLEHATNW